MLFDLPVETCFHNMKFIEVTRWNIYISGKTDAHQRRSAHCTPNNSRTYICVNVLLFIQYVLPGWFRRTIRSCLKSVFKGRLASWTHMHTWAVNITVCKREAVIFWWRWLYFNYRPLNGSSHNMLGHLVLPHSILIFYEEYKSCSSSLCNFLQLPVILSLVCARMLSITIFSNIFRLWSSPHITHEILQPGRTTSKIVICLWYGLYVSGHQT
jgi:hypothetical protein